MIFDILYYDENETNHIMKIESKDIDQCIKDLIEIQDLETNQILEWKNHDKIKDLKIPYYDDIEHLDENEAIIKLHTELNEDIAEYGYIIRESYDQNDNKFDTIFGSAFYEGTIKKENSLDKDINLLNACQKLEKALKTGNCYDL